MIPADQDCCDELTCSEKTRDGCCPSNCNEETDVDCANCGDGTRQRLEECDGTNLPADASCNDGTAPFPRAGTVGCGGDCLLDYSRCVPVAVLWDDGCERHFSLTVSLAGGGVVTCCENQNARVASLVAEGVNTPSVGTAQILGQVFIASAAIDTGRMFVSTGSAIKEVVFNAGWSAGDVGFNSFESGPDLLIPTVTTGTAADPPLLGAVWKTQDPVGTSVVAKKGAAPAEFFSFTTAAVHAAQAAYHGESQTLALAGEADQPSSRYGVLLVDADFGSSPWGAIVLDGNHPLGRFNSYVSVSFSEGCDVPADCLLAAAQASDMRFYRTIRTQPGEFPELLLALLPPKESKFTRVLFHPHLPMLAVGLDNGDVLFYRMARCWSGTGSPAAPTLLYTSTARHGHPVEDMSFSEDGKVLGVAHGKDPLAQTNGGVVLWDMRMLQQAIGFGAPCVENTDCQTNHWVCRVDQARGGYCTQICNGAQDCPMGMTCTDIGQSDKLCLY